MESQSVDLDEPREVIESVRDLEEDHRPIVDAMEKLLETRKLSPGDSPMKRNPEATFLWGVQFGVSLERSGWFEED